MKGKLRSWLSSFWRANWQGLVLATAALLGFFFGALLTKSLFLGRAPVALLLAYSVFAYPKFGIITFLFFEITYYGLVHNELLFLKRTRFIGEVLPLLLFLRAAVEASERGRWRTPPAAVFFLLWFFSASVSAYFGHVPLDQFLVKSRIFWRFFVFYWAVVNLDLDREFVKKASYWALGFVSLNIPEVSSLFQRHEGHGLLLPRYIRFSPWATRRRRLEEPLERPKGLGFGFSNGLSRGSPCAPGQLPVVLLHEPDEQGWQGFVIWKEQCPSVC